MKAEYKVEASKASVTCVHANYNVSSTGKPGPFFFSCKFQIPQSALWHKMHTVILLFKAFFFFLLFLFSLEVSDEI